MILDMSDQVNFRPYQRSLRTSSSLSEKSVDVTGVDNDYTPEYRLGMRPIARQLFRSNDRSFWSEHVPDDDVKDEEASSYAQECALIVKRERHLVTNRVALHSVEIQSPLIRKVLHGTFEGYEGLNTQLKELIFKAPFHAFYHRWHRFEKLYHDEKDQETKDHLNLLYSLLSKEVLPHIEVMEDFLKNEVVTFEYLWAIFSEGMEVYTMKDGQDRIVVLRNTRYGANMSGEYFSLGCQYIDFEGSNCGYVSISIDIYAFNGVKKLVNLDAMPCHLHPKIEDLVDRLNARGKKVEQLKGFHHMSYSGSYIARSSSQSQNPQVQSSRIIIDSQSFDTHGSRGSGIEPIEADALDNNTTFDGTFNVILKATSEAYQTFQKALEKCEEHHNLDERAGQKAVLPNHGEFYVENVGPIRWNENAFSRLVLPHGYKDIIHAFVQEQLSRDDDFDDIIQGKGLGFIMLLSGEPGVGKTLTAESVAEEMRQPLYLMSAGELGETATQVETALELVLELTSKWNAILLLDECDIFLEARTTADIRRNRLVAIFLKQLEYYRGVMFLTTNRLSDFDAAFESRIHLTIHYPALDVPSRLHIWKTFTTMGHSESRLTDSDLDILAKTKMNGRQIKNTVKTARLLSKQKKVPLAMKHIEMVLKVKKGAYIGGV